MTTATANREGRILARQLLDEPDERRACLLRAVPSQVRDAALRHLGKLEHAMQRDTGYGQVPR